MKLSYYASISRAKRGPEVITFSVFDAEKASILHFCHPLCPRIRRVVRKFHMDFGNTILSILREKICEKNTVPHIRGSHCHNLLCLPDFIHKKTKLLSVFLWKITQCNMVGYEHFQNKFCQLLPWTFQNFYHIFTDFFKLLWKYLTMIHGTILTSKLQIQPKSDLWI